MLYNISFKADNRASFLNKIQNNDYDCIIMSHDQFGKIPQSRELKEEITQAELDTVLENLNVLKEQGKDMSVGMLKGLENVSSRSKAVIEAMNEGSVRVLFGSTSMLRTGVNPHKRAVCVHEFDTPWRPSDLEQREGLAIRTEFGISGFSRW